MEKYSTQDCVCEDEEAGQLKIASGKFKPCCRALALDLHSGKQETCKCGNVIAKEDK